MYWQVMKLTYISRELRLKYERIAFLFIFLGFPVQSAVNKKNKVPLLTLKLLGQIPGTLMYILCDSKL
jgi:hypothetical protein